MHMLQLLLAGYASACSAIWKKRIPKGLLGPRKATISNQFNLINCITTQYLTIRAYSLASGLKVLFVAVSLRYAAFLEHYIVN